MRLLTTIALFYYFVVLNISCKPNAQHIYYELIKKADSLYTVKDFKNSALTYSLAFKKINLEKTSNDRYRAACSWALAGYNDSAFYNLNIITTQKGFSNYSHIIVDSNLISLYNDKRWKPLVGLIKQNKEREVIFLVNQLDSIFIEDQRYRQQLDSLASIHGWNSSEMKVIIKKMSESDLKNSVIVKAILDKYGWLGSNVIGKQGNTTLFLIIQHSDLETQEKYLPMMRTSIKEGNTPRSYLALLEDRIALGQGKKQIYGSQIEKDLETNIWYVSPLDDPDNVDKRRAEVGLPPLSDYLFKNWQIKWDVEQYKIDLPIIELKSKANEEQNQ